MGQKLLFFKKEDDTIPCSQVFLQGARVCEKSKGSSDEYRFVKLWSFFQKNTIIFSGSSDEGPATNELNGSSSANRSSSSSGHQQFGKQSSDYSICIEVW